MNIDIEENDCIEVYDKRSIGAHREIKGIVIKVKKGETLGTKWTDILLDSGYKIVVK